MRNELPAELPPERVTVICDPREQTPWDLRPLRTVRQTLDTADYAILGAEHLCRLERKTLQDFIACCGLERDRFTRELERLLAFPSRIVIIEASLADLSAGQWRSKINAAAVIGSIASWSAMGIAFLFAGDRDAAQKLAAKILYSTAKRQWVSARKLVGQIVPPAKLSPNAVDPETIHSFCPPVEA